MTAVSTDTQSVTDTTVEVTIDGETVEVERNRPVIEIARELGHYVPGWCHHPGMRPATELEPVETVYRSRTGPPTTPPRGVSGVGEADLVEQGNPVTGTPEGDHPGCDMCIIEVDGELVRACETRAASGQTVRTATDEAREVQESAMADLFKHHPHDCLPCPYKEGCDRITCTMGVPEEHRCCDLLGNCELEKSAEAIELNWEHVPAYEPLDRSTQKTTVLDLNWELCIGCARCVGVCEDHVGAGVWKFTVEGDDEVSAHTGVTVGLKAEGLAKSGCKYCTACVDACPTGTIMDNGGGNRDRLPLEFRNSLPDVRFPDKTIPLEHAAIDEQVPAAGGVYTLYEDGEIVEINGVANLRAALLAHVEERDGDAVEIDLDENFTQRETELIEDYVNKHGHMPGFGGDEMDDLF